MSIARWITLGVINLTPLLALAICSSAAAQNYSAAPAATAPTVVTEGGVISASPMEIKNLSPEVISAMKAAHEKAAEGLKPASPGQPAGKPEDGKGKDATPTIHRPSASAAQPNRDEFKIRPNAAGVVRLNFNGQPWQPVLEWLASISAMSLDWQDLPGDALNLTTQRSYSVREVRDLINQHLLARGFTLLCSGESMHVVDIKKLDPSLVPRVEPADLAKRDPHEFIKVSFPLDSFPAEAAAGELKTMLSPNGKLTAMNESNRLEAMDAAVNLRDIESVLKQQQARANRPKTFREFKLKFARAEEVLNVLNTLLGLDSSKMMMPGQGQQGNAEREQMMMMARAQQMQERGQGQPGNMPAMKEASVTLAINIRSNSVLAQAPPDKMAIIAQAIEAIDIPVDRNALSLVNMGRMQVYRLSGVDPEPIVRTLKDIGNLDPSTRLEIDKKNSAIIAYAPLADHVTIRALVDKLTGSDRKFEVIRLRRLAADYVAGTIEFMLGSAPKKDQQRRSPWSFYDSPRDDEKNKNREFRVDADVEHNRLLLWANPVELAEVEALLIKLGEMPAAGSGAANVRVIEGGDAKENAEFIERLRKVWPSVAPNELQTPEPKPAPPKSAEPTDEKRDQTEHPPAKDKSARTTMHAPLQAPAARRPSDPLLRLVNMSGEPSDSTPDERLLPGIGEGAKTAPPPVNITLGPDGRMIVSSKDTQALDLLESLAAEMPVARKEYRVFRLKYALAVSVAMNLEDFFKEKKDKGNNLPWYFYEFDMPSQNDSSDDRKLSKRPKLKFISDVDTNTILVEGADVRQLKTIDELIQIYDQPPPSDSQSVRKTELIKLRYSKAKTVADTVKDVYRDLLSSNDKALAENNQGGRRTVINFNNSDVDSSGTKTPRFKGLLSIGVDETSNSLLVSAPAFLFDHVAKMIIELDKAAAPEYAVRMVQVGRGVSAEHVKDLFDQVYNNKQPDKPADKRPADKSPTKKPAQRAKSGGNGNSKPEQKESAEKKEAG
jgi:type II secretory pathway component GspD/PulD (secretin)